MRFAKSLLDELSENIDDNLTNDFMAEYGKLLATTGQNQGEAA